MQTRTHVEIEFSDGGGDPKSAAHATCRPVECGEDPVSRRIDQLAAVSAQLASHEFMVPVQQAPPALIAKRPRFERAARQTRVDDQLDAAIGTGGGGEGKRQSALLGASPRVRLKGWMPVRLQGRLEA